MEHQPNVIEESKPNVGLPPREFWLHNPQTDGLIPTQTDRYGLVDVPRLIQDIKATVDPSYDWESDFSDDHHLYWPKNQYPDIPEAFANPHEFRYLMMNRLDGPRVFHSWLHRVTEPSAPPGEEVMYYRIQAERGVGSLALHIASTKWLLNKSGFPQMSVKDQVSERLQRFMDDLNKVKGLPPEFQPVNLQGYEADGLEDMLRLERTLGRRGVKAAIASPDLQLVA